jgi:beta-glucosidase/6-phospho-beta-glucosidase/beta-galactosidase
MLCRLGGAVVRRPGAQVGIALNLNYSQPASNSFPDHDLVRRSSGAWARWFTDPLYGRHYPADKVAEFIRDGSLPPQGLTFVQDGDMRTIAERTDFLGVNYYTRHVVRDENAPAGATMPQAVFQPERDDIHWQEMENWEVYPDGLFQVLSWLHFNYQIPAPIRHRKRRQLFLMRRMPMGAWQTSAAWTSARPFFRRPARHPDWGVSCRLFCLVVVR